MTGLTESLTNAEYRKARLLFGLQDALIRADRALTGVPRLDVDVSIGNDGTAFTGRGVVHLFVRNPESLMDPQGMATFLGLNYHELMHVTFGPVAYTTQHAESFNILEDQRIESLGAQMWPSLAHYFSLVALRYIVSVNDPAQYGLVAGRGFLPSDLRAAMRKRFVAHYRIATAEEIEELIDQYKALRITRQPDRATQMEMERIIQRFHEILSTLQPPSHTATDDQEVGTGLSGNTSGTPDSLDKTAGKARKLQQENGDGLSGYGEGGEIKMGQPVKGGTGKGTSDDPGNGAGSTSPQGYQPPDRKDLVGELAEGAIAKIMEQAQVRGDARNFQAAMKQTGSRMPDNAISLVPATSREILNARAFAQSIQMMIPVESDPSWQHGHSSGRLNIGAYMAGAEYDEMFDRWDPGTNDHFELEAFVGVDMSGSMGSYMRAVCGAAWVIRKGIEEAGGTCATVAWDTEHVYLAGEERLRNEVPVVRHRGGTCPRSFLMDAYERFIDPQRHRKNRVLFLLTDGSFSGTRRTPGLHVPGISDGTYFDWQSAEALLLLRQAGVVVVLCGMGSARIDSRYPHDLIVEQLSADQFADLARAVCAAMMAKVAAGLHERR